MKTNTSRRLSASTKRMFGILSTALLNLLEEKPFEKITTIDICKTAGVPRATFYNHFDDKYDLLRFTLREIALHIKKSTEETSDERRYISDIIYNLLTFYESNLKIIRKVSSVNCSSTLYDEMKLLMNEILTERMTQSVFHGHHYPADITILAEFYSNGIVYSVKSWIDSGMKIPKETLVKSFTDIIIN